MAYFTLMTDFLFLQGHYGQQHINNTSWFDKKGNMMIIKNYLRLIIIFYLLIALSACQKTGNGNQSEKYSLTRSPTNTSTLVLTVEEIDFTGDNQVYDPEKSPTQTPIDFNVQIENLKASYNALQIEPNNLIIFDFDVAVTKVSTFFESRLDMRDFDFFSGTNVLPFTTAEKGQYGIRNIYTISLGNNDYCVNDQSISSFQIDIYEMDTISDAVNMGDRFFNLADYALTGKNPEINQITYGDWGGLVLVGSPNSCFNPDALGYHLQVDMIRSNFYVEFRLFYSDWSPIEEQKEMILSLVELIDDLLTLNIGD
jgi:hypothetical protein